METITTDKALQTIIHFIESIGIPVNYTTDVPGVFLPGLRIENGGIVIDSGKEFYPGDLLHEAGHLATVPAEERKALSNENIAGRKDAAAEEMMSIAWSFAACCFLQLDPHIVFHDNGYKNGGAEIAESFMNKQYFGVSMLQWVGLTYDPQHKNLPENATIYPEMIKWLRN